ncbi:MAG: bifunctional methionine sulfoxide reductase B/A protein [Planctomycetes bacterium]|nr:bifunctional methionine sulfoxide reductase B/A protein [Planctomycetota bacterium]MBI3845683.1 bifunctional methionine sulfoxide reductase B/A protein [Planctomycetota bacterium]
MNTILFAITTAAFLGLACAACGVQATQTDHPASGPRYSRSGYDLTPLSQGQIAEIVKTLTPDQVRVTQQAGTEPAGTGALEHEKRAGIYVSAVGGLPLFKSSAKFDSGTGWPSFYEPIDPDHVILKTDSTLGMERTEVLDARSGAHLGHVFDDGPPPTGKRFCMNSAALKFIPDGSPLPPESRPVEPQVAYFAGGCFWGVEDLFERTPGVMDAISGYMNGNTENPTYKEVCTDTTGHAESVKVVFDPKRVTFHDLLGVYFTHIDPTTLNSQGPDFGTQYRSAIFAANATQKDEAEKAIKELQTSPKFAGKKIVTIVEMAKTFYPAEEYHQDYHKKHGGSCLMPR